METYSVYEIKKENNVFIEELVLIDLSEGEFKQFLVETVRNLDNRKGLKVILNEQK